MKISDEALATYDAVEETGYGDIEEISSATDISVIEDEKGLTRLEVLGGLMITVLAGGLGAVLYNDLAVDDYKAVHSLDVDGDGGEEVMFVEDILGQAFSEDAVNNRIVLEKEGGEWQTAEDIKVEYKDVFAGHDGDEYVVTSGDDAAVYKREENEYVKLSGRVKPPKDYTGDDLR